MLCRLRIHEYHDLKLQIDKPGLTAHTSRGYYNQPSVPDQFGPDPNPFHCNSAMPGNRSNSASTGGMSAFLRDDQAPG